MAEPFPPALCASGIEGENAFSGVVDEMTALLPWGPREVKELSTSGGYLHIVYLPK